MKAIPNYFAQAGPAYSTYRPIYPAALAAWLAGLVPAQQVAWDAGTGNGQLACLLGQHFTTVFATDDSASQIAAAPLHPRVVYRVEQAEQCSLDNQSVHLVTVAQAAHWFNLPAFYEQVRRVAAPGAVLALIGYGLCRVNAGIDAWVTKFYREVAGPYWPPQRQHLDTAYSHLYFPFTPIATPDLEMVMPVNLHHFLGYLSTWSAVQLRQKQTGINPIPNLKKQLQACWPAKQVREVRFPLFIKAGLVR